jgi:hypothetical protein
VNEEWEPERRWSWNRAGIVVPTRLRRGSLVVEFLTAMTTLGAPLDITLQELRIETYVPATAAAREAFRSLMDSSP